MINKTTQKKDGNKTKETIKLLNVDASLINQIVNPRFDLIKNETIDSIRQLYDHIKTTYVNKNENVNFKTKSFDLSFHKDLDLNNKRILNLAKPKEENDAVNKSHLTESLDYIKNIYDNKFLRIEEIIKQPTKKYILLIPETLKREIAGELFIRNEYQNIYCIFGKIEIITNKLITPYLILPNPHRVNHSIIIQTKCFSDPKIINFINAIIENNTLTFYPGNSLLLKVKTTFEFNSLVSLPSFFPIHTNI